MKIILSELGDSGKESKLVFFQDLYAEARACADEQYERLAQNYRQYKGDKKIDGNGNEPAADASLVRNITYELIESQITTYLPNPSVTPKIYSERNERNAKSIETLLKNKRNELPFEKMNDMDERYNPIYGGSVWLIEWDNSIKTHNTVGDVKISCLNPMKFTGQPYIYDIKDMEYCFIQFETTKDDIVRKYGVSVETAKQAESENHADDKTATLYVCYYKNDDDEVCEYIWSGDTELLDLEDYYARKRKICTKCGKREELCECDKPHLELQNEEFEEISHDIALSDGTVIPAMSTVIKDGQVVMETQQQPVVSADGSLEVADFGGVFLPKLQDVQVPKMEQTKLPFYTPNILPIVIRKNISEQDKLFGQSDCEAIRDQQQAINKIESRIMEKSIGGGVFPIVPEGATVELDNSLYKKVFKTTQANRGLYGTLDLQTSIQQDIQESERLYDHAKRILGITDSFQGHHDSSAQSGYAKEIQVNQSAGRLDSKHQMKNAAYAEIDQIIFQYYLAYADEPRPVAYKDSQGKLQNVIFNRYDFIERDDAGEYYYEDGYLFAADSSIDIEKSRETLWEHNRQNFKEGAYGDVSLPQTLLIFWQNMEQAHYPWAHDNVERIRAEIQRQQEMLAMQQQLLAAQQQNGELQNEVQNRAEYEEYLKKATGGNLQ